MLFFPVISISFIPSLSVQSPGIFFPFFLNIYYAHTTSPGFNASAGRTSETVPLAADSDGQLSGKKPSAEPVRKMMEKTNRGT